MRNRFHDEDRMGIMRDKTKTKEKRRNGITLQGVIIPVEWDEDGNVTTVSVSTFDEDSYIVDNSERGRDLIGFVRSEVEVTGFVEDGGGEKIVRVTDYSLRIR